MDRETLLRDSMPLVERVAQSLASRLPCHLELEDLTQAGYVGLLDAVEKFDRTKGARFWTYAELRIRGAILDSLRELDWAPRSIRRRRRELDRAARRLEGELGRAPTEEELAVRLGVSLEGLYRIRERIRRAESATRRAASFDDVAPYLADASSRDPQELALGREIASLLAESVGALSPRERLVISLYYHEELTMKEVGQVLGVNESRVSQIHSKTLGTLRLALKQRLEPLSRTA